VFTELDAEFSQYVEDEQRGARVAEERVAQNTRGKEQLALAKRRVAEEIDARMRNDGVLAPVVRALVDQGWKDVMLLVYLRQGVDSDAWREGLKLVDDLLWSARPKNSFEERQELLQRIPEILRRLREGLNGISFDQHKMTTLLKELQGLHIACLRSQTTASTPSEASTESDGAQALPDRGEDASEGQAKPVDQPCYEQAAALPVGGWLELTAEDGRVSRAKLSWKSSMSDLCVLVDRRGVKVMDLDLIGLARMLDEGRALPIDQVDVPLFDRALSSVMEALRSHSPGGGRLSA
jgi:hypothetical protein